jgi:predicted ArsR family transcriptional regulator
MNDAGIGPALDDAAVLAEPVRRALYEYVAHTGREVGRDEAARATHVHRALAAFHLDKLVGAGFLETTFRRLSGRSGPGAGRPSKLYRRGAKRLELSVPPRRYEMLARLLADAVGASGKTATRHLARLARRMGRGLGEEARLAAGPRADRQRLLRAAERTLTRYGFEPRKESAGELRLANCPFDALAQDHRDLVCGMNHALMEAFVEGMGARGVRAVADQQPGVCCVALRTGAETSSRSTKGAVARVSTEAKRRSS